MSKISLLFFKSKENNNEILDLGERCVKEISRVESD